MPTPKQHQNRADRQRAYRARQKQALADQLSAKGLPSTAVIPTMPSAARWRALRDQALAALTAMSEEMTDYQSDRSDTWLASDRGDAFAETLSAVDEALAAVEAITLD